MGIRIILFILSALYMAKDFQEQPKDFISAKIGQVIAMICLIYMYGTSFSYVVFVIRKFDDFYSKYHVEVGAISADLNLYSSLFHVILCCVILFFASGLVARKESSRVNLIRIIPFVMPTQAISMYRSMQAVDPLPQDFLVLIASSVLSIFLVLPIIFLYRSKMMKDFFLAKNLTTTVNRLENQKS